MSTPGGVSAAVAIRRPLPAELSSFPCVSISTTTRWYERFVRTWDALQRTFPAAKPLFVYCEEHELIGASSIMGVVLLYVTIAYGVLFPQLQPGMLHFFLHHAFTVQAIIGSVSMWLFRNTDPGFLPVNEGALDDATAALLAQPQYSSGELIPMRTFEPVYTARELEREAMLRARREAAGDYSHLNDEMAGIKPPRLTEEWCRKCRVWRPPRAAHCYVCQQCVLRFDHHCGLLGNCVGQHNHRFFLLFVSLLGSGGLTLLLADVTWLAQLGGLSSLSAWLSWRAWLSLLFVPVLLVGTSFGFIGYFHCRLLLQDVSMKERYGRKRSALRSNSQAFDADGRPIKSPSELLTTREAIDDIWHTIVRTPWKYKRGCVALIEKQAARRQEVGGYTALRTSEQQQATFSPTTPAALADAAFVAITPEGGMSEHTSSTLESAPAHWTPAVLDHDGYGKQL